MSHLHDTGGGGKEQRLQSTTGQGGESENHEPGFSLTVGIILESSLEPLFHASIWHPMHMYSDAICAGLFCQQGISICDVTKDINALLVLNVTQFPNFD